jgi:hypothetical protein
VEAHLAGWLEEIANVRLHATTGEPPRERYARDERAAMGAYLRPAGIPELEPAPIETRKADKTGLIAYRANKYSVPLAYQRAPVGVFEEDGQLVVCALDSGAVLARHPLACGKGETVKNTNHYRDRAQQIADLEGEVRAAVGEALGARLCALLKATSPAIYKDQLRGAKRVLAAHPSLPGEVLESVCARARLTATGLRDYLAAYAAHPERLHAPPDVSPPPVGEPGRSPLARYAGIGVERCGEEAGHELH